MDLFFRYLKQRRTLLLAALAFALIFLASFLLYHLPAEAVLYPAALCGLIGLILAVRDFQKVWTRHALLVRLQALSDGLTEALPPTENIGEQDYQQIITLLREQQRRAESDLAARYADMTDYYTAWAHQIKTPISSMRLRLQSEDTPLSRQLTGDLGRIERYVDMVLVFLRLDSDSSDYVIGAYDLDDIVRPAVKKFAGEFIDRKLKLNYTPLAVSVLTDEKWLTFVVEQVLSNALKYTPSGGVSIDLEAPRTLCVRDTGIGISPEDLPRVFEKGYTGYNGRGDKRASGIGLYLCRRICRNLSHRITVSSAPGEGTTVRIDLDRPDLQLE